MEVTSIRASFKSVVNLGNYSSIAAEVELTATLDEGQDHNNAVFDLMTDCKKRVKDALRKQKAESA